MAVDGVPSSASRWISFRATISFVVLDRPWGQYQRKTTQMSIAWIWTLTLNTVAYVPSPIALTQQARTGEATEEQRT